MEKLSNRTAHALMEQAPETASYFLSAAIKKIDGKFENGYAEKHPELIAAFVAACASDFNTSMTVSALQDIADAIDTSSGEL